MNDIFTEIKNIELIPNGVLVIKYPSNEYDISTIIGMFNNIKETILPVDYPIIAIPTDTDLNVERKEELYNYLKQL